jgi:hypothetical protein
MFLECLQLKGRAKPFAVFEFRSEILGKEKHTVQVAVCLFWLNGKEDISLHHSASFSSACF